MSTRCSSTEAFMVVIAVRSFLNTLTVDSAAVKSKVKAAVEIILCLLSKVYML